MTVESVGRTPGRDLADLVLSLWYRRGEDAVREHLPAAGTVTRLIVDLGTPSRILTTDGDVVAASGGAFLIGPHPSPLVQETAAPTWQCGADLTAVGVAALTNTPLTDLAGRVREAGPILRWSDTWPDRLRAAASADDALEVLQQLLRSVRRPGFAIDARIVRAVARLDADPGIPTRALAAEAGLSRVWFGRLFRRGVGMPPRVYGRLVAAVAADGAPLPVR